MNRSHRLFLLLLACLLAVLPCRAAEQAVDFDGRRVHPTRLLALRRSSPALKAATPAEELLPGLVVLEEPVASARTPAEDAAARLRSRIAALEATGEYAIVCPDSLLTVQSAPADARYVDGSLWGLNNTGANGGKAGVDIGAAAAWDVTRGSPAVLVAIIDSGVRLSHPELVSQLWTNPGESGDGKETNRVDDDGNGYIDDVHGIDAITGSGTPEDLNGHGTHLAGIIGATADGGGPLVGVAPGARLLPLKFINALGEGYLSDALTCLRYAASRGARVVNMSWGEESHEPLLFEALRDLAARGVVLVAAAGNVGTNRDVTPFYPACYEIDGLLSVAAHTRAGNLAPSSSSGLESVDFAAPGYEILSTTLLPTEENKLNPYAQEVQSGTSQAAAYTSGTVALLLSRYPDLTPEAVRTWLNYTSVRNVDWRFNLVSSGRLSAARALTPDGVPPMLVVTPAPGEILREGQSAVFRAQVRAPMLVPGAHVVALVDGVERAFRDDGIEPDAIANDGLLHARLPLPTSPDTYQSAEFTFRAEVPGRAPNVQTQVFRVEEVPLNDLFERSVRLTGNSGILTTPLELLTAEPGEPAHAGKPAAHSLWWHWTAPAAGRLTLRTDGSIADTRLALYAGDALGNLTELASDENSGSGSAALIQYQVRALTTYRVVLDGELADGTLSRFYWAFETEQSPTNDQSDTATEVPSGSVLLEGSSAGANVSGAELGFVQAVASASVWHRWQATETGLHTITVESPTFRPIAAIFQPGSPLKLLALGKPKEFEQSVTVRFDAVAGETLLLAIFSAGTSPGGAYTLRIVPPLRVPAQDAFDAAETLPPSGAILAANNAGASTEKGEQGLDGGSLWWRWQAPTSGQLRFEVASVDGAHGATLYTGDALASLRALASVRAGESAASVTVTPGQVLRLAVASPVANGAPRTGAFKLFCRFEPADGTVANDRFDHPFGLPSQAWSGTLALSTLGCSVEPGEPRHQGEPSGGTIWFVWRPTIDASLHLYSIGNATVQLDTYRGSSVDALEYVSLDARAPQATGSTLDRTLYGTGGQTYRIAIGALPGLERDLSIDVTVAPLATGVPDAFAARRALATSSSWNSAVTSDEPDEPEHGGTRARRTAWWRFVGDGTVVRFDAKAEGAKPVVAVYTGDRPLNLRPVTASGMGGQSARAIFRAEMGVEYQVAVGVAGDVPANVTLNVNRIYRPVAYDYEYAFEVAVTLVPPLLVGEGLELEMTPPTYPQNPTISWQIGASEMGPYTTLQDGPVWQGAATTRLRLVTSEASLDGLWIRPVVSASGRDVPGLAQRLRVVASYDRPQFTTQPADTSVENGAEARFVCAASGGVGTVVHWQARLPGGVWRDATALEGVTVAGTTLSLANASVLANGMEVRALAVADRQVPVSSRTARLTVAGAYAPPTVELDGDDRSMTYFQRMGVSATVGGTPTPVRVWQIRTGGVWRPVGNGTGWMQERPDLVTRFWVETMPGPYDVRLLVYQPGVAHALSRSVRVTQISWESRGYWAVPTRIAYGASIGSGIPYAYFNGTASQLDVRYSHTVEQRFEPGVYTLRAFFHDPTYRNQDLTLERTVEVTKRRLEVSALSARLQPGFAAGALQLQYRGFIPGDDESVLDSKPVMTTAATPASPPGIYPVIVSGGADDHYEIVRLDGAVIIESAPSIGRVLLIPSGVPAPTGTAYVENAVAAAAGPTWIPTGARQFNGNSSSITVGPSAAINLAQYTISAWVRIDGDGTPDASGFVPIFRKGSSPSASLLWSPSSGLLASLVAVSSGTPVLVTSSVPLPRASWVHVACVRSTAAGGTLTLYLNGQEVARRTGLGAVVANNEAVRIGGGFGWFHGAIAGLELRSRACEAFELEIWARSGRAAEGAHCFAGETDLGGNWRRSWFGTYYRGPEFPWIYHLEHGWVYVTKENAEAGVWIYDPVVVGSARLGWLHTDANRYPYLFGQGGPAYGWLFYRKGGAPIQRWFYNTTPEAWFSCGPK